MEFKTDESKLKFGQVAPYFSLKATDGKIYSLGDFQACKCFAVIFTSNHCPYAKAYEQRLCAISQNLKELNSALVAICSNDGIGYPEDSFEVMIERSRALNFAYPYLSDPDQLVARAYGAKCTPEAFLFDSGKKLCYHGAIDDNYADGDRVTKHYLLNAIEAITSEHQIEHVITNTIGCSIKWTQDLA